MNSADAVVVGGGFYGCCIAVELARHLKRVVLFEAAEDLLTRASRVNQARLHNGYHYPRSFLTAARSHGNFDRFRALFPDSVAAGWTHLYALARHDSKVGRRHFERLFATIGAPLRPATAAARALFDARLVDAVYEVDEPAFDVDALRRSLRQRLGAAGVELRLGTRVTAVDPRPGQPALVQADAALEAGWVFNCTYAGLNRLIAGPRPALVHQLAEVALIEPPPSLAGLGITLMDGPFFSTMPFPSAGLHSLTHVRYTPHAGWNDSPAIDADAAGLAPPPASRFPWMIRDAARYVPALAGARHVRSLFDTKTLARLDHSNDARPILLHRDAADPRIVSILGSKLDAIFDVLEFVEQAILAP
jgi:glycine/D-amino acid oxidase-like deaminating enzyme